MSTRPYRVVALLIVSAAMPSSLYAQDVVLPPLQPWELIRVGQTKAEVHNFLGKPRFVSKTFEVWDGDFTVNYAHGKVVSILNPKSRRIAETKIETETILMPVPFSPGVSVVMKLANSDATSHDVSIQQFSADGTLLDSIVRTAVANTTTEVQLDVSPEGQRAAPLGELINVIRQVLPGKPADKAGLRKGDFLLSINGITEAGQQQTIMQGSGGKPLEIIFRRGDITNTVTVIPEYSSSLDNKPKWIIGINFSKTALSSQVTDYDISTGWIRIIEQGRSVTVTATSEHLAGNKLEEVAIKAVIPQFRKKFIYDNSRDFCKSDDAAKGWTCNGTQAIFFVNVSDDPVEVGFCQNTSPAECAPSISETVAPHGMVSFQEDREKQYIMLTSTHHRVRKHRHWGQCAI
jgi:hypothetical protein